MVGLVGGCAARGAGRLGAGDPAAVANGGGEADHVRRLHRHAPADHQCTSTLVKHIKAPVHLVSSPSHPLSSSSSLLLPFSRSRWWGVVGCRLHHLLLFLPDLELPVRFPMRPSPIDAIARVVTPKWERANSASGRATIVVGADCCGDRSQVWELVRSFDQPQRYKPFVSRCVVRGDQLEIGSLREVNVKTGLPATTSTERLEQLDDDEHILGVKFVGGDHRLQVRYCACPVFTCCSACLLL
jgi:hypothetical protein